MKKIINIAFLVLLTAQTLSSQKFTNQSKIENDQKNQIETLNALNGLTLSKPSEKDKKSNSKNLLHEVHDSTLVEDYQATKYIIGETAFALEKGKVMYQNIMGGINTVGIGITDNFTLNLTTEMFSLLTGEIFLLNINPKYTIKLGQNSRVAIGHNLGLGFTSDDIEAIGTTYVVSTFGSEYKNLSVGIGLPYSTEIGYIDVPLFQFGGTHPIGGHFSLMFEAFFTFTDGVNGFISPQVRYNKNNITIDLGFLNVDLFNNLTLPYLAVSTLF